jgi:hypothetical protein
MGFYVEYHTHSDEETPRPCPSACDCRHATMDAQLVQVHSWLQHTLSANQQERQAAEDLLHQHQYAPQHVVTLFRLAADASMSVETALRQAAVIRMKAIITSGWSGKDDQPAPLGDADKTVVRENLVEALIVAPQATRHPTYVLPAKPHFPSRRPNAPRAGYTHLMLPYLICRHTCGVACPPPDMWHPIHACPIASHPRPIPPQVVRTQLGLCLRSIAQVRTRGTRAYPSEDSSKLLPTAVHPCGSGE